MLEEKHGISEDTNKLIAELNKLICNCVSSHYSMLSAKTEKQNTLYALRYEYSFYQLIAFLNFFTYYSFEIDSTNNWYTVKCSDSIYSMPIITIC